MDHIIVSRINFTDRCLLNKYLIITKSVLIPALKSQTQKKFTWVLIINKNDEQYLREQLDFSFDAVYGNTGFIEYVTHNKPNIQTRHDCDDWMSHNYVDRIQTEYLHNIKKFNSFIIHVQPTKFDYLTGSEIHLPKYHDERCSMFLSLCQLNSIHHVNERKHGQMYEITKNIILLPEGYCKWVIHGNNKSKKNK
jgi:hypothetical protein